MRGVAGSETGSQRPIRGSAERTLESGTPGLLTMIRLHPGGFRIEV
jgi:hypothetical protein